MSIIEAIVLGAVQGIAEFLPISSSAHLVVLPDLFGWKEHSILFDVVLHLGTLLAVVLVLWREIIRLTKETFSPGTGMGLFKLVAASVPALGFGFVIETMLGDNLRTIPIISFNLIVWGIVLWWIDKRSNDNTIDKQEDITMNTALSMGVAQVLALIPGTSRSGITMIEGMRRGLTRTAASKFSFLMSIPVIGAAGAYKLLDAFMHGASESLIVLVVGFLTACVTGVIAMRGLLWVVEKLSFKWFAIYRVILGVVLLVMWFI